MFSFEFSEAVDRLKISEIRELMKLVSRPNLILFGVGTPDASLFPYDAVQKIQANWDPAKAAQAYQYCPTSGVPLLLDVLRQWITTHQKISLEGQEIMTTAGAAQGLYLASRIAINAGTKIAVEKPTFVSAMASFLINGAELIWVPLEDDGVDLNKLEDVFKRERPHFFYTIPNFHNPAGITQSQAKRRRLLELAEKYQIWILEDDPYGELYYEGSAEDYISIKSMDRNQVVINVGTFSKMLSPAMRVGWIVGPKHLISKCEITRQAIDACGSSLTQMICADYMASGLIHPTLEKMRESYHRKRDLMATAIRNYFPDWIKVSQPKGGFFIWVDLKGRIGSKDFYSRCLDAGVAFVTDHAFMPPEEADRCCRLSFSNADVSKIERGIEIMGSILRSL